MAQITEVKRLKIIPESLVEQFNAPSIPPKTYADRLKKKVNECITPLLTLMFGQIEEPHETNPIDELSRKTLESAYLKAGHPDLLATSTGYMVLRGRSVGLLLSDLNQTNTEVIKSQLRELHVIWGEDSKLTNSERNALSNFRDAIILGMHSKKNK